MQKKASVEHGGIVENITDDVVRVGFLSHSSCASCHAKGACSLSDVENKYVEVKNTNDYKVGEDVTIMLEQTMGFKALWYGYMIPLLILVLGVIVVSAITGRDGLAGLIALGLLFPYYFGLYLFRSALKNKFEFRLKKIQ